MRSHDSIIVDSADDAALAAVVSAAMIVDLGARGETSALDETFTVEHRIKVDPDVTVGRPWAARGHHKGSVIAKEFLERQQMFTQTVAVIKLFRFILAPGPAIKNAKAICHDEHARVIVRETAAQMSENSLA